MKSLLTILLICFCFVGYGQRSSDYKFYGMDGKDSMFTYTGWVYECHYAPLCDSFKLVRDSVRKRWWWEGFHCRDFSTINIKIDTTTVSSRRKIIQKKKHK